MPIVNICVVDCHDDQPTRVERLGSADAYDFFEQFGFPINTYGMKDDVLKYYGGNVSRFLEGYSAMKSTLRRVVDNAGCLYVCCDMLNAKNRQFFRDKLANSLAR